MYQDVKELTRQQPKRFNKTKNDVTCKRHKKTKMLLRRPKNEKNKSDVTRWTIKEDFYKMKDGVKDVRRHERQTQNM